MDNNHDKQIGRKLRQLREEKKLGQVQLGQILNISPGQVSKYEHGLTGFTVDLVYRLADALGVSPSYFWGEIVAEELNRESQAEIESNAAVEDIAERINETEAEYVTLEASREEAMILAHIRELPARDVRIVKETVEGLWFDNKNKQEKKQRKKDLENPENL